MATTFLHLLKKPSSYWCSCVMDGPSIQRPNPQKQSRLKIYWHQSLFSMVSLCPSRPLALPTILWVALHLVPWGILITGKQERWFCVSYSRKGNIENWWKARLIPFNRSVSNSALLTGVLGQVYHSKIAFNLICFSLNQMEKMFAGVQGVFAWNELKWNEFWYFPSRMKFPLGRGTDLI